MLFDHNRLHDINNDVMPLRMLDPIFSVISLRVITIIDSKRRHYAYICFFYWLRLFWWLLWLSTRWALRWQPETDNIVCFCFVKEFEMYICRKIKLLLLLTWSETFDRKWSPLPVILTFVNWSQAWTKLNHSLTLFEQYVANLYGTIRCMAFRIRTGGWEFYLPPWRWHILSIPLEAGRGISAETCGLDDMFPPDDLGSGMYTPFVMNKPNNIGAL